MKKVISLLKVGVIAGIMGGMVSVGMGADGAWSATGATGSWGTATNWASSIVASGAGKNATFDRKLWAANWTGNLNTGSVVIGNIIVGNTDATPAVRTFALAAHATNTLTMDGGSGLASIKNNSVGAMTISPILLLNTSTSFENIQTNNNYMTIGHSTNGGSLSAGTVGLKEIIVQNSTERVTFHTSISDGAGQIGLVYYASATGNQSFNIGKGSADTTWANTFTGGVKLYGGVTNTQNGTGDLALGSSVGNLTMGLGAVLNYGTGLTMGTPEATVTRNTILETGGGVFMIGSKNGTTGVITSGGALALQGRITGVGGVEFRAWDGTITLSGANDYQGVTTVSEGNVIVTNQALVSSGYVLSKNATLDASAVTYDLAGKTIDLEAIDTDLAKMIFGDVTLGGDLTLDITGTLQSGYSFFDMTGTVSGNFDSVTLSGDLALNLLRAGDVWSATYSGDVYSFDQLTGALSIAAVPEASTYGVIAGLVALAGVLMRRRRE